jgi:Asp-tRNA(Asn)/Glu-tRNA(Gln) amidotransferase B subunit
MNRCINITETIENPDMIQMEREKHVIEKHARTVPEIPTQHTKILRN